MFGSRKSCREVVWINLTPFSCSTLLRMSLIRVPCVCHIISIAFAIPDLTSTPRRPCKSRLWAVKVFGESSALVIVLGGPTQIPCLIHAPKGR